MLRDLLQLAVRTAHAGGEVTLRAFRDRPPIEHKADGSVVTAADRESERQMRALLAAHRAGDGVLGEELGESAGTSGFRWIIDPLDGTASFVRGHPLFGVVVGLQRGDEMLAGVIHMPALGETVAAARGLGCSWNGRPCRVSTRATIEESLVVLTDEAELRTVRPGFAVLAGRAAMVRTWGDCYGPLLVATGRAEVFVDCRLGITDVAPILPIIEEAGGVASDWQGSRTLSADHIVATNGLLHDRTLRLLAGVA